MHTLSASDVRRALPMAEAIEAMKRAYATVAQGRAQMPLRAQLLIPDQKATSLFMPAFVQDESGSGLAVKAVSVFPRNAELGLPLIHAAVLVLDPETGRPQALLEGGSLTAIRTGAASGAATDLLARSDSRVGAIFGSGTQGRTQLEAICTVRKLDAAWVYDLSRERVEAFIEEMAGVGPIPSDLRPAESPEQAVENADIICTATTSTTPVFADADLKPGVHINGVGSFTPEMREIPAETVKRAKVFVDEIEASMEEAGDLIQPLKAGQIQAEHVHRIIGDVVLGRTAGRTSADQITFFKSVGIAAQDVAAAQAAYKNALRMGLGQEVAW